MTTSQALVPSLILEQGNKTVHNVAAIGGGIVLLSALAQVSIALPWTPVPITGQTFGVAMISLLWGRTRGFASVTGYLLIGFLGAPVFAMGKSGFALGSTSGYLFGMLVASLIMGSLADRGWTSSFAKTWAAAVLGSVTTFLCGLAVLSIYLPKESLLGAGLWPFLPGDFLKTMLVCSIIQQCKPKQS